MSAIQQNRRSRINLGEERNALTWLILVNAVIFVILNFIKIVYYLTDLPISDFYTDIVYKFSLPPDITDLIRQPWTFFTYMFSHENVWSLISTALWLWAFGFILQDMAGNNKLLPIYLYGGVAGAVFYFITIYVFPLIDNSATLQVKPLLGGGAAVMAVAIATTALTPYYKIFPMLNGGIPLWVVTLIFVVIDFATAAGANLPTAVAHIAGGGMGFLFISQIKRGNDWSLWMIRLVHWIDDLFNPNKKFAHLPDDEKHFYKVTKKPYEKIPHVTQQRIDEILDKISQKGYDKLSEEEKEFLKKASREDF
jgi:membrane associated rhomboid family serine protease